MVFAKAEYIQVIETNKILLCDTNGFPNQDQKIISHVN